MKIVAYFGYSDIRQNYIKLQYYFEEEIIPGNGIKIINYSELFQLSMSNILNQIVLLEMCLNLFTTLVSVIREIYTFKISNRIEENNFHSYKIDTPIHRILFGKREQVSTAQQSSVNCYFRRRVSTAIGSIRKRYMPRLSTACF